MGIPLFLIFLTIILLSVTVVGKTMYNRKKVTCMTGMMIAMTLGMIVGLTMGVVFGILFIDNFFVATILGMMGAMLGAMSSPEYREAIVKIMFFLFLATLLILLYMIQKELNRNKTAFYMNPLITVVLFGFFFVVFNQLGPIFKVIDSEDNS